MSYLQCCLKGFYNSYMKLMLDLKTFIIYKYDKYLLNDKANARKIDGKFRLF